MKKLIALLLISTLMRGAATDERFKLVQIGTASNDKASKELPYCVAFNENVEVFSPPEPTKMVANFFTNSPYAAAFLKEKFISIFQQFKEVYDVTNLGETLEIAFNLDLATKVSTEEHAQIIENAKVKFSIMHILLGTYCNIVDNKGGDGSIFGNQVWCNGMQGGNPYSKWAYLDTTIVLHPKTDKRITRAVDGELDANKSPDEAAELALATITDEKTWKTTKIADLKEMLSIVRFNVPDNNNDD